jgi:hypothetical protein
MGALARERSERTGRESFPERSEREAEPAVGQS